MPEGKAFDYDRLVREAALALKLADLTREVVAHAETIAEHTAERFEPVGSTYYLDQYLTVAGEDFLKRMPWHGYAFAALVVPHWVERFSVLSRTRLAILQAPDPEPGDWGGTFHAVGLCKFGSMPSLINPQYDYTAVYPCRAPRSDEW
jgi:hypothetical protein